jgi:hypothetical protein
MPTFEGPTYEYKIGLPEELWFVGYPIGKTVVKSGGTWRTLVAPDEDFLKTCTHVLRGGFKHEISQALATELTNAGYGDFISQ